MALNGLICADVPLSNYSLTHSVEQGSVRLKVKLKQICIHLIKRLFIMNHYHRSAQVWHVFSRDFTVLSAHPHVHPQSE